MVEKTPDEIRKSLFKTFDVDGRIYNEEEGGKKLFVIKYWLENKNGLKGEKERFRHLDIGSFVRNEYEKILMTHDVDDRYVRFVDQLVYVSLKEKVNKENEKKTTN